MGSLNFENYVLKKGPNLGHRGGDECEDGGAASGRGESSGNPHSGTYTTQALLRSS